MLLGSLGAAAIFVGVGLKALSSGKAGGFFITVGVCCVLVAVLK